VLEGAVVYERAKDQRLKYLLEDAAKKAPPKAEKAGEDKPKGGDKAAPTRAPAGEGR